jgi:Transposase protein/Winged helix-turn helix
MLSGRSSVNYGMATQRSLPIVFPGARIVSARLAVHFDDELFVAYGGSDPIYTCRVDDRESMRLAVGLLGSLRLAGVSALAEAMGVSRETVRRNRDLLEAGGVDALVSRREGPREPYKMTAAVQAECQRCLDRGWTLERTAKRVDLSEGSVRYAIRQGRLHRVVKTAEEPCATEPCANGWQEVSLPCARARQDQACEHGVAVKRLEERSLARVGKLSEAMPEFTATSSVSGAGVLLALPALVEQGLVDVPRKLFGTLRNGFFGLQSVLLTLAFMALLRIKTPEQLTGQAPGELGLLLGLDRAPEVKTLRRKLAEMGRRGLARLLHQRLAERWAEAEPDELGLLYIDGHVRPYHGRCHKLPKLHVQQRGRPMPGTQDFHVNDHRAEPLFMVTAAATEGMLAMMDRQLLPEIRRLVGPRRRVTVVFDREGWSPARFARWKAKHFDVLTYRKGKQSRWQERFFAEVEGCVDGHQVSYRLAERSVKLKNGLQVREVRRLTDSGHQTAVITTNERLSTLEVAHSMFSRWRQENFFRYMRQTYALDHLCTNDVEPADPERMVPHPQRNEFDKQIRAARTALGQLVGRQCELKPGETLRLKGRTLNEEELDQHLLKCQDGIKRLKQRRDALPKKVLLSQVLDADQIVQLERERKILTDAFKMIAYRAESQMARWIEPFFARHQEEARKFLQSVFQATADLIPDHEQRTLTVHFHGLANPRATRALSDLCDIVNETPACFPGTDLRMQFQAPQCNIN